MVYPRWPPLEWREKRFSTWALLCHFFSVSCSVSHLVILADKSGIISRGERTNSQWPTGGRWARCRQGSISPSEFLEKALTSGVPRSGPRAHPHTPEDPN